MIVNGDNGDAPQHLDDDLCLDLLHGLLPDSRRAAVMTHLETCDVCSRKLLQAAGERERLRVTAQEHLQALDAADQAPLPSEDAARAPARRMPSSRRRSWLLPVAGLSAAAIIVLVALGPRLRTGPLPDPTALPDITALVQARDAASASPSPRLLAGLRAYARGDLNQAVEDLSAAPADDALEAMRRAYLGSALVRIGRHREAVDALLPIADAPMPEPWHTEARWTLYVSLRKIGAADRAAALLDSWRSDSETLRERASWLGRESR